MGDYSRRLPALAAILLLAATAAAQQTPPSFERQAQDIGQEALGLIAASKSSTRSFNIDAAIEAYYERCSEGEPTCFINECDAGMKPCRADRLLLFRGEGKFFGPVPSSALSRACAGGSEFCAGRTPAEALETLKDAVSVFRPTARVPADYKDIVLIRDKKTGSRRWVYLLDLETGDAERSSAEFSGKLAPGEKALSFRQIVFLAHKVGAYLYYQDRSKGALAVDPLISFTSNPDVAIIFAGRSNRALERDGRIWAWERPRLIVLSVPEERFDTDCGDADLVPGEILAPINCGAYNYEDENEYPAMLLINPDDVIGNFPVPKALEKSALPGTESANPAN